jgi:hypothetical protein
VCDSSDDVSFLRADPRIPGGNKIAEHSSAEHQKIKVDLKAVDTVKVGDPEYEALLSKVVHEFVAHADEEEAKVLPLLKDRLNAGDLLNLGERFENAATIVTTRPVRKRTE